MTDNANPTGQPGAGTGDLVERVAVALHEEREFGLLDWVDESERWHDRLRNLARAVIPLVAQAQRDADVEIVRAHRYEVTTDPSYNDGVNAGLQTATHLIEHAPLITPSDGRSGVTP